MGFDAVNLSSDAQLKDELGIKQLGVRLSLRAHCERLIKDQTDKKSKSETEERKRRLLEEIINPKKDKATSKQVKQTKPSRKGRTASRNVLMGWIHCDQDGKPTRVSLEKGGGTRQLSASTETTYDELIEAGKAWFFPSGMSKFGEDKEMTFGLADFQRRDIKKKEGNMTFTVGNYAEKNGFKSRIRVYLTSQTVETVDCNSSSESENSFGATTSFNNSERRINVVFDEPSLSDGDQAVGTSTSFLGTKAERDALLKEQDQAYFESLATDQEKEKEKKLLLEKELNDVERQTFLRDIRESRLPQEPDITEDHVLVSVRHITQGVITRSFYPGSSIMQLYDWVGSLQLVPEYFKLVSPISGKVWLPEHTVDEASKCILNMIECNEPLSLLAEDSAVNTAGFLMLDETLREEELTLPGGETGETIHEDNKNSNVEEKSFDNLRYVSNVDC